MFTKRSKKILAATFTLTALAVASPMIMQSCFTEQYDDILQKINDGNVGASNIPLSVTVVKVQSNPGYWQSKVISRVSLNQDSSICFELQTVVNHGLSELFSGNWSTTETTLLEENIAENCSLQKEGNSQIYSDLFANGNPISVNTKTSLMGDNSFNLETKRVDISLNSDNSKINIIAQPISAKASIAANKKTIKSQFKMDGVDLAINNPSLSLSLTLDSILSNVDLNKGDLPIDSHLWQGTAALNVNNMQLIKNDDNLSLPSIFTLIAMNSEGGDFSESANFTLSKVKLNDNDLGDFDFNFGMLGLNAESIDSLSEKLDQPRNSDADGTQSLEEMVSLVKSVLTSSEFTLSPTWTIEDSSIKSDFNVKFVDLSGITVASFHNAVDAITSSVISELNVYVDKTFESHFANAYAALALSKLPESHRNPDVFTDLQLRGKERFSKIINTIPGSFKDAGDTLKLNMAMDKEGLTLNGEAFDYFTSTPSVR